VAGKLYCSICTTYVLVRHLQSHVSTSHIDNTKYCEIKYGLMTLMCSPPVWRIRRMETTFWSW
jgi:hypothetical protein